MVHLHGTAAGSEEAEVVEAVNDVIGEAAETRLPEADDAVAGRREVGEDGADAHGIGPGNDTEIASPAPDGLARPFEVVADGLAVEKVRPGVESGDASRDPAIEKGRAERDEPAGAGIGIIFEGVANEDPAHAVADGVDDRAGRGLDEGAEAADVFLHAQKHGVVMKLADAIPQTPQAMAQRKHFPAVDDGTVDENNGLGLGGREGHGGKVAESPKGTRQ